MFKEIKYLILLIIIIVFIFLAGKYYFSDENKKNSYRSFNNIEKKIILYSQNLPVFEDDTFDIIEYVKNPKNKKKKYFFWDLINKND